MIAVIKNLHTLQKKLIKLLDKHTMRKKTNTIDEAIKEYLLEKMKRNQEGSEGKRANEIYKLLYGYTRQRNQEKGGKSK